MVNNMLRALLEVGEGQPEILYHMCYPTHNAASWEDITNQLAIREIMNGHDNIIIQPGIDAFALANHIAKMGFRVGMLNSANANRLWDHWKGERAFSAIDENIHRRSHMLCLTSECLNGKAGSKLADNVQTHGGKVNNSALNGI